MFTVQELAGIRKDVCRNKHPDFDKIQLNTMIRIIETDLSKKTRELDKEIDKQTAPYRFTAEMKQATFENVSKHKNVLIEPKGTVYKLLFWIMTALFVASTGLWGYQWLL